MLTVLTILTLMFRANVVTFLLLTLTRRCLAVKDKFHFQLVDIQW